jgi:hypothetical protein
MKYLWGFLLIILLVSCEKSINVQPQPQKSLLVVDGSIENGKSPYVILSTSLNYFSKINPEILLASVVSGAKVTISDGTTIKTLKEYSSSIAPGYNIVYYGSDTTNQLNSVTGQPGQTYKLQVLYNQQQYTAVTTIPVIAKTVDSLWWKPAPNNADTTKVVVMGQLTDPAGFGNYIRYFTRVNSEPFLPGAASVYDDQLTDGRVYDYQMDQGIDRNNPPENNEYGYFKRGDTVTAKLANIDKATFDFWRTLEFAYQSVGNPFSNPIKVLGNVSNGALGAFCGYGAQYRTIIIPK